MADPIDTGLSASIKALEDVVAKSVDTANPLACEQLRLVSRYLGFLRQRLPFQQDRDRFELGHALALAMQLREIALPGRTHMLDEPIADGERVYEQPGAPGEAVRSAARGLNAAASVLVRCAQDYPERTWRQMEQAIVKSSQRLFDVQRAWYLPMGFEPDPRAVPALQDALVAPTVQAR